MNIRTYAGCTCPAVPDAAKAPARPKRARSKDLKLTRSISPLTSSFDKLYNIRKFVWRDCHRNAPCIASR